jgi:hypothetical protein
MTALSVSPAAEPLAVDARTAARMIGVSQRTLWSLTAPRGPVPVARIGNRVVYRIRDLDAYLAGLAAESAEQSAAQ